MLGGVYSKLEYGWDTAILYNAVTWQAEIDRYGDGARLKLFPSYCYEIAMTKDNGDRIYGKTASGKKLRKMAEKARTLLERHREESERLARLDSAHRSGDPGEAVLAKIEEKIGETRYRLFVGAEATCTISKGIYPLAYKRKEKLYEDDGIEFYRSRASGDTNDSSPERKNTR